ncbi:hypothetical protein SCLCIDRAFT_771380 [Scleroderma citrinum Foug A]|uniref:Uncharacterized protein n=1 Tax=Scleroderma citrinum Foug A TaxID=1036808 RepID=A0A0C2ZN05_9AGAM|nr:hypothetical protein SCLCIDRAFT_771380 [Scleroderma citrinum Foug A]
MGYVGSAAGLSLQRVACAYYRSALYPHIFRLYGWCKQRGFCCQLEEVEPMRKHLLTDATRVFWRTRLV